MSSSPPRSSGRWTLGVLIVLPVAAIFAPVLFQDRSFAFRDTAAFYYPLFEWIERQSQAGELPLWNPHVNFGTPVVGEGSSCVLYPGKAIFLLPLEFSWAFKLYVIGHVLLAAAGACYAARVFGTSAEAAALAALSYACGGAVLFQYCNIVFLVGAAWLPWSFAATEIMLTQRSWRAALALGIALAMMVLGGDAQMAYHTGLAAAAYGFSVARTSPQLACGFAGNESPSRWKCIAHYAGLLGIAAVSAFALAAVQILPSAETSAQSDRAAYHAPRSIYEAIQMLDHREEGPALTSQGLFRAPEPDSHAASIYQFSFAPWHLPEYLWPNYAGRYFPQYRLWLMAWPGEPRMWNQSVYLGLLPILLAVASLKLRRGTTRERWLSWCVVLAVLGSFGAFGIGWCLRRPLALLGQPQLADAMPGEQVGGIYWFFVTFLPGYAYFRFPAKLLTFAACPLALLAAQGLDRLRDARRTKLQLALLVIVGISLLGAVLSTGWIEYLARFIPPDAAYGPFDKQGARDDLLLSMVHTLVLAGILFALLRSRQWITWPRVSLSLVAVTAADLVIANAGLIGTAPSEAWRERPLLAEMLEQDSRQRGDDSIRPTVRPPLERDVFDPQGWHTSSSPDRLEDLAVAQRQFGYMNHTLAGPLDAVETLASQRQADYHYFFSRFHKNEESLWGNYWLMPRNLRQIGADDNLWQPLKSAAFSEATRLRVFRHNEPMPRAWIVHEVTVLPELTSRDPYVLDRRGREIAEKEGGERRDWAREAVVESNEPLQPPPEAVLGPESCRVVQAQPNSVLIEVELNSPGLLILADAYYPGWMARSERTGELLPIVRTDRMFRGIALPAGQDRITFEYAPQRLHLGGWISGLGWIAVGILAFKMISRRSSNTNTS